MHLFPHPLWNQIHFQKESRIISVVIGSAYPYVLGAKPEQTPRNSLLDGWITTQQLRNDTHMHTCKTYINNIHAYTNTLIFDQMDKHAHSQGLIHSKCITRNQHNCEWLNSLPMSQSSWKTRCRCLRQLCFMLGTSEVHDVLACSTFVRKLDVIFLTFLSADVDLRPQGPFCDGIDQAACFLPEPKPKPWYETWISTILFMRSCLVQYFSTAVPCSCVKSMKSARAHFFYALKPGVSSW
jgi:hypothetical protein